MEIDGLLNQMTRSEKCRLLVGADHWSIPGCERLGIPGWAVSDGPAGVRGRASGPGLVVPSATALAATWDPDRVHEIGQALGRECIDKHIDLLLAPTINLHRVPYGGRHFESYSEDPYLSSRIAVGYITGVQSTGVGACAKHFVANDQETDRFTIDAHVDERTLREILFPPFEAAVTEARVASIMGAYNFVNGVHACADRDLLIDVLRNEWGFEGIVVSDWYAITDTLGPALGGLDLEMPGPGMWWGNDQLLAAVEDGRVPESVIDDKVRHILSFLDWRGRLPDTTVTSESPVDRDNDRILVRRTAAESMVVVSNDGLLPLRVEDGSRLAIIGPGAADLALMGGGSAALDTYPAMTVVDAARQRWPQAMIAHTQGADLRRGVPSIDRSYLDGPVTIEVFVADDPDRDPLVGEPHERMERPSAGQILSAGAEGWPNGARQIALRMTATVSVDHDGDYEIAAASNHRAALYLDGDLVADNRVDPLPGELGMAAGIGRVHLAEGHAYRVVYELIPDGQWPFVMADIGLAKVPDPVGDLIAEAVEAAARADQAILVVGTSSEWETEGSDRSSLALPAGQDELVRRVIAAQPRTVVVVNAGAPVTMDWLDDAAAVVLAWYPGLEGAAALVDVLSGDAEPAGRMPTTWFRKPTDAPAVAYFPGHDGVVSYDEGIFVGYRGLERHGIEPLIPFGHGGSYTTFEWGTPTVHDTETVRVEVPITNTGDRHGTEVVQVYVSCRQPRVERPPRELAGFAKVSLSPGASQVVEVELRERACDRWDLDHHGWVTDPGIYEIQVGASSADIRSVLTIER